MLSDNNFKEAPKVTLNWEYGLVYNLDLDIKNNKNLELKKSLSFGSRVLALKEQSNQINIYDSQLRPIFTWRTEQMIADIFLANKSLLCALTKDTIFFVDGNFKVKKIIKIPHDIDASLGCSYEAGSIVLVHNKGIVCFDISLEIFNCLPVPPIEFKKITGIDYHLGRKVFGVTNAADNIAFLIQPDQGGEIKKLGGGFHKGNTQLVLHSPRGGHFHGDEFWVADANNNRLTCFNLTLSVFKHISTFRPIASPELVDIMWRPTSICSIDNNSMVVCDSKNRRLLIIDQGGYIYHMSSPAIVKTRKLNLPRGITVLENKLIIADSHNNRLLELDIEKGAELGVINSNIPWPRHAIDIGGIRYVVSALLPFIPSLPGPAAAIKPLDDAIEIARNHDLSDPHQLVFDPKHGFIIVSSGNGQVLVFQDGVDVGIVISDINNVSLGDPHSADFTYEGGLAITDTLNNRLLFSDQKFDNWREISEIHTHSSSFKIRQPRFITKERDGRYLFIDTGTRSIYCIDDTGFMFWSIGSSLDLSESSLNKYYTWQEKLFHDPRWVVSPCDGLLFVADTGNSRIVSLSIDVRAYY